MEGRSGGGGGGQRRGGDVLSTRLKASVNASFLRLHSRPLPCEVRKGGLDGGGGVLGPGFPSRFELRFG